jgi:hypothetical protein
MTDMLDSYGFAKPDNALRFKKIMEQIATQELGGPLGGALVGRCMAIDIARLKADIWFPGDPEPVSINMFPGLIPGDAGDSRSVVGVLPDSKMGPGSLCLVEVFNGKQYVSRVLSGGQFAYDLGAAGLAHKVFNTSHPVPEQWDHTPQVSGTFGRSFSFFLPSNKKSTRIGPFVALGNGVTLDGMIRINLSRYSDYTTFECAIHDGQLWDSNTSSVCWMRMLPKSSGRTTRNSELAVDLGILKTGYRDPTGFEIWLRFTELDPENNVDFTYANVEAFGPIISFGDPQSGRLLVLDYTGTPTQIGGYFGFHDSAHGMRNRFDEAVATDAPYNLYSTAWSPGSYMDSATRVAEQLAPLWSTTGAFTWNGSRLTWTNDIVFSGIGPYHYGLTKGRYNVPMIPSGTKIPVYPSEWLGSISNMTVTTDANGVPLSPGDTLYFGMPPGMGNNDTDGTTNWQQSKWLFFIVDSESYTADEFSYKLPQWAIPIAHRTNSASSPNEVFLTAPSAELIDNSQYVSGFTTTSPGISTTETGLFSASTSMRFKNGCAYRVKFRCHVQGTAATQSVRFRLRKGTTSAGTEWVDFGQFGINGTNVAFGVYHEAYLVNTSGADITTQTILTAVANVVSPGITLPANTTSQRRWYEIEYAGPAAKYASQGHAIT